MVLRYYKENKQPHVLNALKYIIPQEIIDILPEIAKEYLFKKLAKHTECDNIAEIFAAGEEESLSYDVKAKLT